MKSAAQCRDMERLLSAYVDHEASAEEMRLVDEHVASCAECAARLAWLQRLSPRIDARLQALLAHGEAETRRLDRRLRPPPQLMLASGPPVNLFGPLATAAVLLVFAALVAVVLARSAPTGQPRVQPAAQPQAPASPTIPNGHVAVISIDGLVDPPTAAYVHSALATAEQRHDDATIIELTPSGELSNSVQEIQRDLGTSSVTTYAYLPPGVHSTVASALAESTRGAVDAVPANAEWLPMDLPLALWHRLLDPTTAYLFFVLGLYAVFVEIAHPGALLPGITGAVCLALAAFAFSTLPTNWIGVTAVVAGVALMGLELKAARHGLLVLLGVVSLGIGSLLLFATPGSVTPALTGVVVAPAVLIGVVLLGLVLGVLIARLARRIHRLPPLTGLEQLIGARGVTRTPLRPDGVVHVQGQLWSARARGAPMGTGEPVRVLARNGLVLEVESAGFRSAATQKGAYR